ncbi:hypothetical protein D9757_008316 [Collybiopsis confluens]|uniref:WDR90 4th beta-propeller domain-containing protein n=1 Tax=Collybiopsis confluens TaxID=2823264 RepID=A0A8H5HEG4_9AGAR|nr:hypothetical protein D9757_008316 [Collybiopsis confluens]
MAYEAESLTAILVLEKCQPKVTTKDCEGVKVGTISQPEGPPAYDLENLIVSSRLFIVHDEELPQYPIQSDSRSHGLPAQNELLGEAVRDWNIGSAVISIAFSPGGTQIVSGSSDGTVRLWDATTGTQIGDPLRGHTNWVQSVAFSPDGAWIVSGSSDRSIRSWAVTTGTQFGNPLLGHTDWVQSVAFSSDGTRIASGSMDKTVRIWDATAGEQVNQLYGHTDWVNSVTFSPDGTRIVSGSSDKTVRIWAATSGHQVNQLDGHFKGVTSVAFSPDGEEIVSGSWDGTIRIWDTLIGNKLRVMKSPKEAPVLSVKWTPDGRYIASASDGIIRLWEASNGRCILQQEHPTVKAILLSPDGQHIASGSRNGSIQITPLSRMIPPETQQSGMSRIASTSEEQNRSIGNPKGKGKDIIDAVDVALNVVLSKTAPSPDGSSSWTGDWKTAGAESSLNSWAPN